MISQFDWAYLFPFPRKGYEKGKTLVISIDNRFKEDLINPDPSNIFYGLPNFSNAFLCKYNKWGEINNKKAVVLDNSTYRLKVCLEEDGEEFWFFLNPYCVNSSKECNCEISVLMTCGCRCGAFRAEKCRE